MQPAFTRAPRTMPATCRHCGAPYQASVDAEHGLCANCYRAANGELYRHTPGYAVDTGIGICPACGSTNLSQTDFGNPPQIRAAVIGLGAVVTIAGGLLFWPVILVGIAMVGFGAYHPSLLARNIRRHCNLCQSSWTPDTPA